MARQWITFDDMCGLMGFSLLGWVHYPLTVFGWGMATKDKGHLYMHNAMFNTEDRISPLV